MTVKLHFHGATRTVTGSCYLIETERAKLLVDCGMFQGSKTEKELNYRAFPFRPASVDAMLLTHAHIDHAGVIPKLCKQGFTGKIHATAATVDLCRIMLPDSGFIQESEVRILNERNRKRGRAEVEPIYTAEDAQNCLAQFIGIPYEKWITPVPGIRARYWNAGHLLGSASIEVEVEQAGKPPLRVLFSGDIGPEYKMLQPDPTAPSGFDYVICESTYGDTDRLERDEAKRRETLASEINAAAARRGALLIPSFAVERTQEVVTDIVSLMKAGRVPQAPLFIDSPLANKATEIFTRYAKSLENGHELFEAFESPLIRATESVEESKAINRFSGFHIIVAASGMCEAGRIRHHLKNNLWKPQTTVLLVGFQAVGSLGRLLHDGEKAVKIHGDEIEVKATIRSMDDYSGHADAPELEAWIKARMPIAKTLFLTHGEEDAQLALEQRLLGILPNDCVLRPRLDDVYDLSGEKCAFLPSETHRRMEPEALARPDWHNDLAKLVLDINEEVGRAADEKSRAVVLRRLRRALEEAK
jgi:metallo-beta-lactamase family protein